MCFLDNDDDAIENDHEKFVDDEDDDDVTTSDDYTVMQNDDWKSAQTPSSNPNKSTNCILFGCQAIASHLTRCFLNILGRQPLEPLDNNLPFESFMSKTARLNAECSNPGLQENCVVGQKWRCFLEDGQWRKHKCKFHVSTSTTLCPRSRFIFVNL